MVATTAVVGTALSLLSPYLHSALAVAQDGTPVVDPTTVVTTIDALGSAGPWAMVGIMAWNVMKAFSTWEPTIQHRLHPEDRAVLRDLVDHLRRRSPEE